MGHCRIPRCRPVVITGTSEQRLGPHHGGRQHVGAVVGSRTLVSIVGHLTHVVGIGLEDGEQRVLLLREFQFQPIQQCFESYLEFLGAMVFTEHRL